MSEDIDSMRAALSHENFLSRAAAVHQRWVEASLDEKTKWTDKLGREYNFVESFFKQWTGRTSEWYLGAAERQDVPGTNNGAE